jgi:hypothetical protein
MRPAALVATVFLSVVAAAHLLRVLFRVEVVAAGWTIPIWMSLVAVLFTGGLAIALARENRRKGGPS